MRAIDYRVLVAAAGGMLLAISIINIINLSGLDNIIFSSGGLIVSLYLILKARFW